MAERTAGFIRENQSVKDELISLLKLEGDAVSEFFDEGGLNALLTNMFKITGE